MIRVVFLPLAFSFLRSNIALTFHVLNDSLLISYIAYPNSIFCHKLR